MRWFLKESTAIWDVNDPNQPLKYHKVQLSPPIYLETVWWGWTHGRPLSPSLLVVIFVVWLGYFLLLLLFIYAYFLG